MKKIEKDEISTEWTNKDGLIKRYEGLNRQTLSHWLVQMRADKHFRKYVINPTPKLVWINLEGFHEFMLYKQRENYRRR